MNIQTELSNPPEPVQEKWLTSPVRRIKGSCRRSVNRSPNSSDARFQFAGGAGRKPARECAT